MSAPSAATDPPRILRVTATAPERDVMDQVVEALAAGALVAYPTDTFYGLGVDPANGDAVESLFRAKGRESREALPLIASSLARLEEHFGVLPPIGHRLAEAFWPGPLTLVVPKGEARLAAGVTAGRDTVAVRVPAHLVARAVAEATGGIVTSTSANRSGEAPASSAAEVVRAMPSGLAIVLDAGPTIGEAASTIVDVTGAHPRLIRPGRVAFDRVLESLK